MTKEMAACDNPRCSARNFRLTPALEDLHGLKLLTDGISCIFKC